MADTTTWAVAWRSLRSDGTSFVNTICVRDDPTTGALETPSPGEIVGNIDSWLTTKYRAMLAPGYTVQEVHIRELYSGTPREAISTVNGAGTGAAETANMPVEVCKVISWKTNVATRRGRGRIFVPSPVRASALNTADAWATADTYWSNATTFINALLAGDDYSYGTGGAFTSHQSLRVHSRAGNTDFDVTAGVQRVRPHWLRSRSTSP